LVLGGFANYHFSHLIAKIGQALRSGNNQEAYY